VAEAWRLEGLTRFEGDRCLTLFVDAEPRHQRNRQPGAMPKWQQDGLRLGGCNQVKGARSAVAEVGARVIGTEAPIQQGANMRYRTWVRLAAE
jgi:hypothetical protein